MDKKTGYKVWIIILSVFSILGWGMYLNTIAKPESYDPDAEIDYWSSLYRRCEANYDALENDLAGCEFDLRGERMGARADQRRIEFLEGQLDSCNIAYSEEKHDRLFYQNALEDIPAYCPEELYKLTIAGLVDERNYCWGIIDGIRERRGAPCHSHYDGLHCTWETCTLLYDCAFGELGWIGPDRVMCDNFGNTSYNEARTACFSDRNCSSCIQMTGGDLGHCWAFAYKD